MKNLRKAVANARDAQAVLWRYRVLVAAVFVVSLAVAITVVNNIPRQYVAAASVLVANGNTRDDPTLSSPDLPTIVGSSTLLERVKHDLNLNVSLLELKSHLAVKSPAYKSSIIRIEFTDSDPTRVALVANDIADQLAKYYREILTGRFDSELRSLQSELGKQGSLIRRIDRRLRATGDLAADSVDSSGTDLMATRLTTLETERELSQATLEGDSSRASALQLDSQTRAKILRHDVLQGDDQYRGLMSSALSTVVELENVRGVYTKAYPGLPALETKNRSLRAAAASEATRALQSPDAYSPSIETAAAEQRKASAVVQADAAKVGALDSLIQQERGRLATVPPLALMRLQRSAAQSDYLSISGHRATALANRDDALSLGSVIVTDRALATEKQVGLGHRSLAVLLTLLAVVFAGGSAFLAEEMNPRLRKASKIEDLYGHPVVATLGPLQ